MSAPAPETFLSGQVGHVGRRAPALRAVDAALDAWLRLRGVPGRRFALASSESLWLSQFAAIQIGVQLDL